MNIDGGGQREDGLAAAEVAAGEQLARRLGEEVEPGGGVVADVGGDVGAGGGDERYSPSGHFDLRHAQAVGAEVDADRVGTRAANQLCTNPSIVSPLPRARRLEPAARESRVCAGASPVDLRFAGNAGQTGRVREAAADGRSRRTRRAAAVVIDACGYGRLGTRCRAKWWASVADVQDGREELRGDRVGDVDAAFGEPDRVGRRRLSDPRGARRSICSAEDVRGRRDRCGRQSRQSSIPRVEPEHAASPARRRAGRARACSTSLAGSVAGVDGASPTRPGAGGSATASPRRATPPTGPGRCSCRRSNKRGCGGTPRRRRRSC